MDLSEEENLANGLLTLDSRRSGRKRTPSQKLPGFVVNSDGDGGERARPRFQPKKRDDIEGKGKKNRRQANEKEGKKKRFRTVKEKREVKKDFVAQSSLDVKNSFLSLVPCTASRQLRLALETSFGERSTQIINIGSFNKDRANFLNKELPLYSNNKFVLNEPVVKSEFPLTQGLGFAQDGEVVPSVFVVNTEAINSEGFGGAGEGCRNYKFNQSAFGREKGAKTAQNEVAVLAALGKEAQNCISLSNLFNWTLSQSQSDDIKHDFSPTGHSFEAGLESFELLLKHGARIFIPQGGKTEPFWETLPKFLVQRDNAEVHEVVMLTSTALGNFDLPVIVVLIPARGLLFYIVGLGGHGSQLHQDENKIQKAAAYTFALHVTGKSPTSEQNIAMSQALFKMKGTSYINGDERKQLHEQGFKVKSGLRKGITIMSYEELGVEGAAVQEKIEGYEDSKGNFFTSREEALAKGVGKIKSCIRQRMAAAQEMVEGFVDEEGNFFTSREEALAKGVGKIKSCIRQRMGRSSREDKDAVELRMIRKVDNRVILASFWLNDVSKGFRRTAWRMNTKANGLADMLGVPEDLRGKRFGRRVWQAAVTPTGGSWDDLRTVWKFGGSCKDFSNFLNDNFKLVTVSVRLSADMDETDDDVERVSICCDNCDEWHDIPVDEAPSHPLDPFFCDACGGERVECDDCVAVCYMQHDEGSILCGCCSSSLSFCSLTQQFIAMEVLTPGEADED